MIHWPLCRKGKGVRAIQLRKRNYGQGYGVKMLIEEALSGMELDEKMLLAESRHMGKTNYFFAPACELMCDESCCQYSGKEGIKRWGVEVTNCS
jgi:hypothetical protein